MAGSKRNRLKKALSPSEPAQPSPDNLDDDDELMNDLLAQLDSRDQVVQVESATILNDMQLTERAKDLGADQKPDPKSRYVARQARKAAAIAQTYSPDDPAAEARLEKEAKDEENAIARVCDELGLVIYEINPDGHCLFSAVADQLALLAHYAATREAAANYIHSHPDEFIPFLPSASGEDGAGALDAGLMNKPQFDQYCISIRDTSVWGGEPEILALSRAYQVPIHVIQGSTPPIVVHDHRADSRRDIYEQRAVRISYHRRMYGLGEHYNSLRPKAQITRTY
ncbi:OTU-domain-containing protein [Infundibulicybe gibba]|nr:OTU-domain-containing protein [Infundibulicybe gibba]